MTTARNGAIGLAGAMHGKSFFTAALAWDNHDRLAIPDVHRIAAGPEHDEAAILRDIEDRLRLGTAAALYIEPIHGTSFGWQGSTGFYRQVRALTARYGTLLIYDEVLTGFHRTGDAFRFLSHGVEPDIVVFGKACGNGFPVGGTAVREGLALSPRMLLSSTFSNNALAAAAISATLSCLRALNPAALVQAIERTVLEHLGFLQHGSSPRLRGAGAMWVISMDTPDAASAAAASLRRAGVCIGFHGRQLRLLPPATIHPDRLGAACKAISEVLQAMQHA